MTGRGTPSFVHGFPHIGSRSAAAPPLRPQPATRRRSSGFARATCPSRFSSKLPPGLARFLDAIEIDSRHRCTSRGLHHFGLWRLIRDRARARLSDTRAVADTKKARTSAETIEPEARGSDLCARAMLPGMVGKSTREREPSVVATMRAMLESASVDSIVGASEAMMNRPDATASLATIDVPTLIVVGEEDVLTPPKESHAMHAAIRGSRLEIIPGAGHVSNVERPAAFNQVLSEFLAAF